MSHADFPNIFLFPFSKVEKLSLLYSYMFDISHLPFFFLVKNMTSKVGFLSEDDLEERDGRTSAPIFLHA